MKIRTPQKRWFAVPDDEDGARIEIRQLTPAEHSEIVEQTMNERIEYRPGEEATVSAKPDARKRRELFACKRITSWVSFHDENGKEIPCNAENVLRYCREVEGFLQMIEGFATKLSEDIKAEEEERRKNLKPSQSASSLNPTVKDAKP